MSQTGNYSRNENWCETVDTPLSPLHPASIPLPLSLVHPPTMMFLIFGLSLFMFLVVFLLWCEYKDPSRLTTASYLHCLR